MHFTIRAALKKDLPAIAEIGFHNWKVTYKGILPEDFMESATVESRMKYYEKFLTKGMLIAIDDAEQILGFLAYEADAEIENCMYIDSLHVAGDAQRKGIGTALIKAVSKIAEENGMQKISVCVVSGNENAKHLYEKFGAEHHSFVEGKRVQVEKLIWEKRYYHAYNERYKAIHAINHTWAADVPTPIVLELIKKYQISKDVAIFEIGCGEGRDSIALLEKGYQLLASDVSEEAIRFCKEKYKAYQENFKVVDACRDWLEENFDFIFATSVLHMLVENADRKAFWGFIHNHLKEKGVALVLTMGDGENEFSTDVSKAFELQERTNNAANIPIVVTNTSCRMVNFESLQAEVADSGFVIVESGMTESLPDFSELMYVLVKKEG